ncbi:FMN-binding glutamate synthase family protein [Paracoccus spongiarum]|uniref:FMN-binding glutamate synthase family protein n=1 Tax=Paracoccus spongiarum TaxID=3064387 RepID=A0ABT9JCV0_9RHOB|nr:FMN-binding glutamate synthase family protein [Paracoccus sp. 2205BS29-5]MDP5307631.1 FMN-binding glutamate synthase family protein [Paracoccus sp. 2205BS29-5]
MRLRFTHATEFARHYERYLPFAVAVLLIPMGLLLIGPAPVLGVFVALLGLAGTAVGIHDLTQTQHALMRNYPLSSRMRYLLEHFRPEIRQYFVEDDHAETPFSREQRAVVYRRSKGIEGVRPFGTLCNVYSDGYEWLNHSMATTHLPDQDFRIRVGGPDCTRPYDSSVVNISGMSYGALSPNAIEALNRAAKAGGFAHTTGEGSISRYHRMGGDLVWQIGSGYFGCRDADGGFSAERFTEAAADEAVKMIEIKLSQGAKPGHGGILPGPKVTTAIAEARGVPVGVDCISPSSHSAFSTPRGLCSFIARLREMSGGKPVGIKMCVGHPWEWFALAKAFRETGIAPDFITVDGGEGGTGAAPVEFADHKGAPLRDGLMLVHNTLVGLGIRDRIKLVASAKIVTAFDICRISALGADGVNMARGFMFAIGCIQAQACHTGKCPTGITTQDPDRYRALVVPDKAVRAARFHAATMHALKEACESSGLRHPDQFTPHHLMIRTGPREVRSAASLYDWLQPGELVSGAVAHPAFAKYWHRAQVDSFAMTA